ncbi:MAG: hypothetical protein KGI26_02435 [Thaumarchaeota archaeon]|nr:hypothetical protein [Nitrososphaerota archaeon]
MNNRTAVLAAVAIGVIAIGAALASGILPTLGGETHTSCTSCTQGPIVDVIMPALGSSGNFSNASRMVNMSAGESKAFEVDVYPTAPMEFSMSFNVLLAPGPGAQTATSKIVAAFNPQNVTAGTNAKGTTLLTLTVSPTAPGGTYDVVVSAANQSNSSQVWGLYFEISVG